MTRLVYRIADWELRHARCIRKLSIWCGIYLVVAGILEILWK